MKEYRRKKWGMALQSAPSLTRESTSRGSLGQLCCQQLPKRWLSPQFIPMTSPQYDHLFVDDLSFGPTSVDGLTGAQGVLTQGSLVPSEEVAIWGIGASVGATIESVDK